jgi:hypothetical protein
MTVANMRNVEIRPDLLERLFEKNKILKEEEKKISLELVISHLFYLQMIKV